MISGHPESKLKLDLLSRHPLMMNIDHQVYCDFFSMETQFTNDLKFEQFLNDMHQLELSNKVANFMLTMFYVNNGN